MSFEGFVLHSYLNLSMCVVFHKGIKFEKENVDWPLFQISILNLS